MLDITFLKGIKIRKILLILLTIGFAKMSYSQTGLTGYLMPTLSVTYPIGKNLSQRIDIESRNFAYSKDEYHLQAKHLEFLNFTKLKISDTKSVGFGIRYRVEANKNSENEFRLHQQYEWRKTKESIFQQRVRAEQRIYYSHIKYRFRYKTEFSFDIKSFCDVVNLANEVMVELTKNNRPNYEERLLAEAEWKLFNDTYLALGTQYRLSNFTHNPSHNIFLTAGLTLNL